MDCRSASFCDYNYDGLLDLLITANGANYLYRNMGGSFVISYEGLEDYGGYGAAWGDFDLDGDFDVMIINTPGAPTVPDRFYRNMHREGFNGFLDRTEFAGVGDYASSYSTEWADYNNDGKPDLFLGNATGGDPQNLNKLYRNIFAEAPLNRYFDVRLIGTSSNQSGIGSHVVLKYQSGGSWTQQMAEVSGGGTGYRSQGSLPIEFGVGEVNYIDSVLVYWPAGDTSIFEHVATNQKITIVEQGAFADHDMVWDRNVHGDYYISGDITLSSLNLQVNAGTHVYFHKTWRTNLPAKFLLGPNTGFTSNGTAEQPVVFTSQYASPAAGDWLGIQTKYATNIVSMTHTVVSYGEIGFNGIEYYTLRPQSMDFRDCRFMYHKYAGIDLAYPSHGTATQITNCYFERCGDYGIRVRKDIQVSDPAIVIYGDTILNCTNGIWYVGNSNSTFTKRPDISSCVIRKTIFPGSGNGIYVNTPSATLLPAPTINYDSITGFSAGMYIALVDSHCVLTGNKVKHNQSYGLYLQGASPRIIASISGTPNVFNWSNVGIFCDKKSAPYVRDAKIKENLLQGVLVDRLGGYPVLPDFGTAISPGNNSIDSDNHMLPYYDMQLTGIPLTQLNAQGNWWGEYLPNPSQIAGDINYANPLSLDPLPGYERREVSQIELPQELSLSQNYPNPFNPTTEISFSLPADGFANLKIYNIGGQLVKTLISENLTAGEHKVMWDGNNSSGIGVASGVYYYILSTDYARTSKSMTLLR